MTKPAAVPSAKRLARRCGLALAFPFLMAALALLFAWKCAPEIWKEIGDE